jgi:hypothetical protein
MAKNFWEKDEIIQPPKTSTPWESDALVPEEQPSQLLDPAKMFASGVVGPTAAIPMGLESAARNIPRQIVEQQGIAPVEKIGPLTFAQELARTGPAQLLTNTARAFVKKATGESFEQQQEKQKQNEIAVDRAISNIPRVPGLSQLADAGKKVSEDLRQSVSAAGQKAIADSQVEGNILESIQKRSLDNLSFGKDPSFTGYALQGSQVLGSLVPIIGTAVMTKGNTKAIGTVGFGMGAGEAVQDATDYVGKLSDEQLMESSPYFKKMVQDGVDPLEARKVVIDKAAEYAAQLQGSVAAFGGVITGKLITGQFDKAITGPVKNRLGRIALGTTAGSLEEGTQEFLEGVAKDLGINKSVIKEIGEESFANFVLGAMGGAGPGAYRGAVAKTKEEAEAIPPKAPKLTPAQRDAEMLAALSGQPQANIPPTIPPLPPTPPTVPPPSGAVAEEQLEIAEPTPRVQAAPSPMLLQTEGMAPELAAQIQSLEQQFQMIEQRKLAPNLTQEEAEILQERQNTIQQNISQLIQATAAPTGIIEPLDPELKARATMRFEQLFTEATEEAPFKVREMNKLARELDIEPSTDKNETAAAISELLYGQRQPIPAAITPVIGEQEAAETLEELPKRSQAKDVPVVDMGAVLDPTNPDVLAKTNEIMESYEPEAGRSVEGDFLQAVRRGIQAKQEVLEAPNRKNMAVPAGSIEVAPFNGGFVAGSSYTGPSGGYGSGLSTFSKVFPTREEAIADEAKRMRKYADESNDTLVKKWLDTVSPPTAPIQVSKEEQIAINKARQEEKKAKVEEKPSKEDASEKKMFDAIEDIRASKGTANQFIAKYGKAMFDRANTQGLIENTANDQRLFTTVKQDELFTKFNRPEEYAQMMERRAKKEPTVVEMPEKEAKPAIEVSANKIFTEDAATKARNRLRSKLNQLNSGVDPEFLIDGITLSGYHIEKGARTFSAYAKAMIADLGDKVKPYLKQWYNAVRDDPSAKELVDSMDTYDQVQKAALPDTTDGMMDLMDPEDKFDIAKLLSATMTGPNPNEYKTILEARAFISKLTGKKIEAGTAEAKEADEAIETAIVLAARDIIDLNRKNGNDFRTYDDLVGLYERQPNLSVRTSTSVKEQAYSTPVPLAYVASRLAGITQSSSVYEPTAGNGMLLIAANPKNVIANELNATRYEMLERIMDGAIINNENAVELNLTKEFDAIIANPPFGVVKNRAGDTISYDVDGLKTNEIDHAISFKALNSMKEDGRAVLIVGGVLGDSAEKRVDGYRSKSKREFYYNLYNKYNVVDHFTVAGDLYKKQGAAYPVDIIVIDGKGKSSRKLPAADLPKVISSYEQLKEKLNEPSLVSKRDVSPTRVDSGDVAKGRGEQQGLDRGAVGQGIKPSPTGEQPTGGGTTGVSGAGVTPSGRGEPTRNIPSEGKPRPENKPKLPEDQQPVPSEPKRIEPRGATSAEANKPGAVGGTSQVSSKRVEPGLVDRRGQEQETANQVGYDPHSQAGAVGTLAPSAMAKAIDESLTYLEDRVGDIDNYVASKLDFEVEDLKTKFSAEQVDALALAIDNAEQGKGFIIGDQTGVGKGRVVAGMIKYALLQGQIPIFMTQKPNLYSDMIRDLDDIGMTDVLNLDSDTPNILITQADEKIPFALARKNKNGEPYEKKHVLKNPVAPAKHNDFMKQLVRDNDLGKFKVIFSVYDSMNTQNKKLTERAKMVEHFADNNYLILDESHAAGGSGGDPDAVTRAGFIRKLVNNSKGSFFSSATYAKRPDVMDLYSTTDMKLAVDNISELAEAIKRGGVPMQQAVANMLTKSGQYIRRERTFAGVSYDTKESKVDKPTAENMATAMRSILNFSDKKKSAVKELKKELDEMGAIGGERDAKTEVEQANFGSTMHNLIDQMLLSLKTAQSVDFAIERLKTGEKVVLTVANTMGSFMDEYAEENGINKGDPIDLSFRDLFLKYLDKQRFITIKYPDGKKEKRRLTDEELGPTLVDLYQSVENFINNAGFGAAPVSPIDYMHNALKKAGYKTDEITGRNMSIDYSGDIPILRGRTSDIAQRVNAVDGFNNGDTDVIILNQAGSTGLSLHASTKFRNQQKRHMIIVQPEKNIDTHMQMLGRVHRTGQIDTPTYSQMMADIPAEMRPAAVLLKKMASLNANTTASRKSSVTAEGVVDFMNDYGGQVVQEYLKDNPEVYEATGKKIKLLDDATEGTVEDITKFTGYIPILPIAEQEEVYKDITERYNELLDRENSMGTNKLEARAMDLDAITVSTEEITEQKEGLSEFAKPAVMERVDVKRTVKPYSSQEVKEMSEKNLDGKTAATYAGDQVQELATRSKDIQEKKIEKALEDGADAIRIDTIRNQIGMQTSKIRTILQTYRIGNQISLTDPNGGFVYGVIVNITTPKASANATAPSNWKMQIALANGDAKSVTISFSQIDSTYKLKEESYDINWFNPETQDVEYVKVIQIFDKGSTARREKRWMITGNLLAGFAKFPGQIVNYTRKDAEGNDLADGQGILLPRQFDFEKAKEEAPVRIKSAEDVLNFLKEVPYSSVGTQDKVLRVVYRNGPFSFVVPKSKRVGGTFFLDEGLMKALGTQFTQRGSDMIANTWQEDKALAAIDYILNQRQNPIIAIGGLKEAREMFAKPRLEEFTGITSKQIDTSRDEIRSEKIKRSAALSRGITAIKRKIIKGNIGINIQRELTFLEQAKKEINKEIAKSKPARKSAEWVRAKAAAEVAANNIDNDTYKVIEALATRYPAVLDGLTLSMQKPNVAGVAGNFDPISRIVTLYKGSATDKTMRHEIAHSMEQLMTPEAQTAVVNAWADALQKAIEKNTDQPSQDYFEAVFDYLQNPTQASLRKATDLLPNYNLYQFLNPSEYWAVNAEPLLKAQLGGGWQRFKKAMQRMLETIKDVLGFDNKRAIHREFSRIMSGDQQRMTETMLVEYVTDNADALKFLNNVEDFDKQFQEDNLNHTPVKPSRSVKDMMLGSYKGARQLYRDAKDAPVQASQAMGGKLVRAITYVRNKNIWFGAGLEMADLARQKSAGLEGQLRDGEGKAVASIAVTNALRAGHIASEVIIRGALAFNGKTQMFQAIRRPFSMANVLLAKHDLIERVGLQRATDMINTFFEAKRSKSILDELEVRQKELQSLNNEMNAPRTSAERQAALLDEILQAEKGLRMIGVARKKVRFSKEQIEFYGNLDKQYPELRAMLENWTKVNDNMIDMMLFSKIISQKRAEQLKGIKDYVPWYRIQDDMEDLHQASNMGGIKRLTNVGKEKRFEDTIVVQDIDDIVDNMLHNVAMITRNSMRNHANYRVVQEYATRNSKGQIRVFPEEGRTSDGAVRTNILINGRRIIVEIKDPLIAEAVIGMENINMPAMDMLGALANGLRRGITIWPQFQIRQLFMDAPTAAMVSGVKNPTKVWAGTFRGFIKALQADDPVVDMLKSYGIGGFQSYTRTPEIEFKKQIGLLENSKFDGLMNLLDRVGDSSDYGQRISIYNNVLAETGDEMLALLQANNVIDFLKRGSARHAQFLTKTVAFMNAYAQQIDVLATTLAGKRLVGKTRSAALAQLAKTGGLFGFYVMLYSMAVGDDDEYQKLDDQTKVRNIFLSKNWTGLENNILIPMHTSASFMFKSIPELIYNYVTTEGTDNQMDASRLRTALREAAFDSLLGPNPVPTGIKPAVEIILNKNFFTGGTVTPRGMEDLDAAEQYTSATSNFGKVLSAMTSIPFSEGSRVLNPIEADHLVRGLLGTNGSAMQWLSNLFGEDRPTPSMRQNPLYGSFVSPDVARGNEELFYDFKSKVDNRYETYMKLLERDKAEEADKYFNKHGELISARDYVTGMEVALRDLNRQIRMTGEVKDKSFTPDQRREEIIDLQRAKQDILDGIVQMRLESGL